jgi:hypothetical protein
MLNILVAPIVPDSPGADHANLSAGQYASTSMCTMMQQSETQQEM